MEWNLFVKKSLSTEKELLNKLTPHTSKRPSRRPAGFSPRYFSSLMQLLESVLASPMAGLAI